MTYLRQRMLEELQRRNYSPHTIRGYLRHVSDFARHFHRSPDQLNSEHVREYQLNLIRNKKPAWATYNQIMAALRFFYTKTLNREFVATEIPYMREPQRLPVILSQDEVARLLEAPPHRKSRALLMTIYAAGLRVSEVAHLRVSDIAGTTVLKVCSLAAWRGLILIRVYLDVKAARRFFQFEPRDQCVLTPNPWFLKSWQHPRFPSNATAFALRRHRRFILAVLSAMRSTWKSD